MLLEVVGDWAAVEQMIGWPATWAGPEYWLPMSASWLLVAGRPDVRCEPNRCWSRDWQKKPDPRETPALVIPVSPSQEASHVGKFRPGFRVPLAHTWYR